jgi:hypothetical protein
MNNHGIKPTTNPTNMVGRAKTGSTPSPYHKPQYSMDKGKGFQLLFHKKEES